MMQDARRLAENGDYEGAATLTKRAKALQAKDDANRFVSTNRIRSGSDVVSATPTSRPAVSQSSWTAEQNNRLNQPNQRLETNARRAAEFDRETAARRSPGLATIRDENGNQHSVDAALADASPREREATLRNLQGADPRMIDQVLRERRRVARMGQQSVADPPDEIVSARRAESARPYLARVVPSDDPTTPTSTLRAPDPRMAAGRYGLGATNPWSDRSFKAGHRENDRSQTPLPRTRANGNVRTSSSPMESERNSNVIDSNVRQISNRGVSEQVKQTAIANAAQNPTQIPTQVAPSGKNLVTLGGVTLASPGEQDDSGVPGHTIPSTVTDSSNSAPLQSRANPSLSADERNTPQSSDLVTSEPDATEPSSDQPGRFFSQLPGKETILQAPSTLKSAIYSAGQGIRNGLRGEWLGVAGSAAAPNQPGPVNTDATQSAPNSNNIKQLPTANADGPWSEKLQLLIRQTETEVATSQPGTTDDEKQNHIARHVQLRMLYLIAGQFELALQPVPGVESNEQEFWQQMFWGMSSYFDSQGMPDAEDRAAETIAQLRLATARLEEKARLRVRTAAFSRKINGFGDFQDIERNVFSPGQPILIYAEIANFKSEPTTDGKFRSVLKSTIEVATAGDNGEIIDRTELPPVEDVCKSVRRDYFNSYKYTIPPQATLGRHVLTLTVEDKLSGKLATYRLNFTIE